MTKKQENNLIVMMILCTIVFMINCIRVAVYETGYGLCMMSLIVMLIWVWYVAKKGYLGE